MPNEGSPKTEPKHKRQAARRAFADTSVDTMTACDFHRDPFAHLEVAVDFLKDKASVSVFEEVIIANKHLFRGKIVLDVGCGLGLLSLLAAKAGAARVFAVDPSNVCDYTRGVVQENKCEHIVQVIQGRIEDVQLPVDKVDIILCDWMGYSLLYENMAMWLICARDRFLCKDGIIFPDMASLYVAAMRDPKRKRDKFDYWLNVYEFKMTEIRRQALAQPSFVPIMPEQIISTEQCILQLDMNTATVADLKLREKILLHVITPSSMDGIVTYFQVGFSKCHSGMEFFGTDPWSPNTRWMQSLFFLDEPCVVQENEKLVGGIEFHPVDSHKPNYNNMLLSLELFKPERRYPTTPIDRHYSQLCFFAEKQWHLKPAGLPIEPEADMYVDECGIIRILGSEKDTFEAYAESLASQNVQANTFDWSEDLFDEMLDGTTYRVVDAEQESALEAKKAKEHKKKGNKTPKYEKGAKPKLSQLKTNENMIMQFLRQQSTVLNAQNCPTKPKMQYLSEIEQKIMLSEAQVNLKPKIETLAQIEQKLIANAQREEMERQMFNKAQDNVQTQFEEFEYVKVPRSVFRGKEISPLLPQGYVLVPSRINEAKPASEPMLNETLPATSSVKPKATVAPFSCNNHYIADLACGENATNSITAQSKLAQKGQPHKAQDSDNKGSNVNYNVAEHSIDHIRCVSTANMPVSCKDVLYSTSKSKAQMFRQPKPVAKTEPQHKDWSLIARGRNRGRVKGGVSNRSCVVAEHLKACVEQQPTETPENVAQAKNPVSYKDVLFQSEQPNKAQDLDNKGSKKNYDTQSTNNIPRTYKDVFPTLSRIEQPHKAQYVNGKVFDGSHNVAERPKEQARRQSPANMPVSYKDGTYPTSKSKAQMFRQPKPVAKTEPQHKDSSLIARGRNRGRNRGRAKSGASKTSSVVVERSKAGVQQQSTERPETPERVATAYELYNQLKFKAEEEVLLHHQSEKSNKAKKQPVKAQDANEKGSEGNHNVA